ncbi:hypothetical protein PL599_22720, partial [Agrobacterium sp. ST15.16.055]|uniref:hypothetical protein n=1 Tax=Agrobacterium sp. ST15.16.055 TaxID=3020523 RepID=UPI002300121C
MDGEPRHTRCLRSRSAGVLRFDGRLTGAIYVLKSTGKFILFKTGVLLFHSFLRKEVIQPQVPL